jgi:hypothetical protein
LIEVLISPLAGETIEAPGIARGFFVGGHTFLLGGPISRKCLLTRAREFTYRAFNYRNVADLNQPAAGA